MLKIELYYTHFNIQRRRKAIFYFSLSIRFKFSFSKNKNSLYLPVISIHEFI